MTMNYERVRELQRKERNVSNIVELDDTFYSELAGFVKDSTEDQMQTNSADAFRELENVMRLSRDLFDKREQKILLRAMRSVRTGELDDSHMTPEEKRLYCDLCSNLNTHRSFFNKVLLGDYTENNGGTCAEEQETLIKERSPNITLARVRKAVPRFVGSDSNEYGPFAAGDVIKLPKKEADFLSQQNLVEIL